MSNSTTQQLTQGTGEENLSFKSLHGNIIEKGLCALCYGCICFCSANELNVLTIKEDVPAYYNEDSCHKCGICYQICPRTTDLDTTLETKYKFQQPIGHYESIRCLQTTDEETSRLCCDGGVVTSILRFLLETGRIEGAIVSKKEGLWNNQPMIATRYENLLECAGSNLSNSTSIRDMGDLATYASIFGVFKESMRLDLANLAVVGTPCQIQTIRKMQLLHIVPSHLIRFTIGLFCFENFIIQEAGKNFLEEKIGAKLEQIKKINLKDDFIVTLNDSRVIHIDLEKLGSIIRPACYACVDFSNFAADISVGGLGSPDGYTTTMVRSKLGKTLVNEAIKQGYVREIENKKVIEKIEKMVRRKRERSERFLAREKL